MPESNSDTSELITAHESGSMVSGSSVPLFLTTAYQDALMRRTENTLPKLPSHRFRFSVWHDVSKISTTGDKLRAPRVRNGPPEKERVFYHLKDENDRRIHHTLQGRMRQDYQNEQENWEDAVFANLPYQELYHDYQKTNFLRILKRLKNAEDIVLMDNGLVDLSSVTFPKCRFLNLTRNYIASFKKLPHMPHIEYLNLDQNDIEDEKGLEKFASTPLRILHLRDTAFYFKVNYRKKVFRALPNLERLDNVPRRPEDLEPLEDEEEPKDGCIIS